MARVLKNFEFRPSRARKYDWDTWLDGRVWELKHGEDFLVLPERFRVMAISAAARRGLATQTRVRDDTVVLQARDKEEIDG